jgi:hypothetical protein
MVRTSLRFVVLLLCGLLCGLALWSTTGLAEPPSGEGVTPEPFPFSDRYPAEVVLESPQDLDILVRLEIDVGQVRLVDEARLFPAPDEPFEPLLATIYINDGEAERLREEGLAAYPIPNESLRAWLEYGPGGDSPPDWPTFDDFVNRMQSIADNYPDLVRMLSIGQSVQGRELWLLKISDNPDVDEDEPEFEYISTMHGNESVGTEMTLRLAELLMANYGVDPDLTELVDEMEIWLFPIYNPDGYVAGSRYNAHGVDLNRNYPDRITDPVDDPSGREPETQAFMNFGYGRRFVMGANYHTGTLVVNYPWDSVVQGNPDLAPDDALYYAYSVGYAIRNPAIWNGPFENGVTRGWEWYIIRGGLQDWTYHWWGEHHVTIEVSNQQPPPYNTMDDYWDDNRDAMLWWMRRALTGVRGLVTDATNGEPLDASVDVLQIGKPVYTDPDVGDYHRLLLPDTYTVTASAYCYEDQSATVTVVSGTTTIQDFPLNPATPWTVEGTVTEEGTGAPLEATIEFFGAPVAVQSDPATGYYSAQVCAGTYTMRVSAPAHRTEERVVTIDGDQTQDFALGLLPCTLLVDDDAGEDYQTWYEGALDGAGQEYDVWSVAAAGSPTADDLAGYGRVVWLTGDESSSTLTSSDQAALATYLDGGGRLFVSGQDIGYDIGSSPFYADYLHALFDSDDTNSYDLTGMDYLAGVDVTIQGGDGANNQSWPSDVTPIGGAVAVMDYLSPHLYGGVAYQDDTYGVVYFSFGFEAINNQPDRTEVMSRTLNWLGGCPSPDYVVWASDSEESGLPGETVTHTFSITNMGTMTDSYDITLTQGDWPATLLDSQVGPLAPLDSGQVQATVQVPSLPPGRVSIISDVLTLAVTSVAAPEVSAQAEGTTNLVLDLDLALATDDASVESLPGQAVTYTLMVTNTGGYTDTYELSLTGNAWPAQVTPTRTQLMPPGEAAEALVRVEIPAEPGITTDALTVRATSGWDAGLYAEQGLLTRAVTDLALALSADEASKMGVAGQTVTYTLVVSNTGGYTDTYDLSVEGNYWPVQVAPMQTLPLTPGEAQEIQVQVAIPAGAVSPNDTVTVRATSGWDPMVYEEVDLVTVRLWSVYLPLIRK